VNPHYSLLLITLGCGKDQTISSLANLVADTVGFHGEILWDATKPDGTPRKLLDVSRLTGLGWSPKIDLEVDIATTYESYINDLRPPENT
jgi:GDP-L-fucose synthase